MPEQDQSIYQEHGYQNRKEYLQSLADDYGVLLSTVVHLARLLGKDEDFDGLVAALEDCEVRTWGL